MRDSQSLLKRSNQLLEASQAIARVGGWELDLITNDLFWTKETYHIHDTTPDEFDPTLDAGVDCYLPESREILLEALKEATEEGKGYDLELELKTTKGRDIHVRTTCEVTFDNGKPSKLTGAFQDITDRKNYEEKIKESEAKIGAILNSLTSSVCVIDETGKILKVNEAWNEFGLRNGHKRAPEFYADYNYFDVCRADFPNEDAMSVYQGLHRLLKGEIDEFDYEYPCHAPDKKQWFLLRANIMRTKRKQVVISHIDITDRKNLEISQDELFQQSQLAVKTAKLGVSIMDMVSGRLHWNDELLQIYGLSRDELLQDQDAWQQLIHPEDVDYAKERLADIFNGKSVFGIEFRVIRKNGEIRYIDASGSPVYNETNELIKSIGINRDITEIKRADEKLKNSEGKFSNAFDNSPHPTSILNIKTGERLAVNNAYCETFGYSKSELLDGNIHLKSLMEDQEEVGVLMREVLKTGNLHQHPANMLTRSGDVRNMLFNGTKLYTGNEDIYIVSLIDATEAKKNEKRLKESDRVFNLALDMFCIAGFDGYFKHLNPAWERTLGWSTEELLSKPWINFVYPDDQNKTENVKAVIVDGREIFRFENRYVCKDGSIKWLSWNSQPFPEEHIMVGVVRDVTEQKKQERALKHSENRLQRAQQVAKLGSWYLDIKTNVVTWTEELFKMFGLDPAKPAPRWNEQENDYTKESWSQLFSAVEKASKDGTPYHLELNIIRKDKTMGWITSRGEALKNDSGEIYALSGIAQDITGQRAAEIELRKLSIAVEQNPISIVITDTKGNIEYANPRFSEVSGYALNEVLGQNPRVLQSGHHDEPFYKNMWETLISGNIWNGELLNKNKNGELYWESATISPLKNSEGVITSYVAIKEDITIKKRMVEELQMAKQKAEEANQLKDEFLANMSHEIRTPLNAIIGFSRLMNDDLGEQDKEIYLDQIRSNSEQLLSLVNDLLNITKIESGNLGIKNKIVSLSKLVQSVFTQHLHYIETHHKNLKFKLTAPETGHDFFLVDEVKLKEILYNLIDNAIKFTKDGTIEMGCSCEDKEIKFFVKDDGIGILPQNQEKLFNRFSQVAGTSEIYGGTGLGLAICKGLVDKMGGRIWVESTINSGATFHFTIPKLSTESIPEGAVARTVANQSNKLITRVLIADDSASVRLFYKTIMKKHMIDNFIAKNGEEAVDYYQKNMDKIDLVLMDIRMPGIGGIEAMKRIKKINPDIQVIAQTAFAMDTELDRFLKEGFDNCLTKPIPEDELLRLVKG